MPPGTRRANRGAYAEHDDFEGLPVRQWRQEVVNIAPPSPQEQHRQSDIWAVELPYNMPKDSHLLPPHSQELLRAARAGRLYKRPPPVEDEDLDHDVSHATEKPDKRDEAATNKGFAIKTWRQIPRNAETEISHLAKRRKNTVTIASKTPEEKFHGAAVVTRATVRRVDAAGNPYTEEMTLNDGQQVEGEIISTRVEAVAAAHANESAGGAALPRRRPPPPKRKAKAGPGRGKKKIRNSLLGSGQPVAGAAVPNGTTVPVKTEGEDEQGVKQEGHDTPKHGSEMAEGDGNGDGEGEDGEEGEDDDDDEDRDDGEDGEDGDDGDDGDERAPSEADRRPSAAPVEGAGSTDQPMADAPPPKSPQPQSPDVDMIDEHMPQEIAPTNPLTLTPPARSLAAGSPKFEGSPLKNVVMPPSPELTAAEHAMATQASHMAAPEPLDEPTQATEAETVAESMIAEPPSTIVGEAPEAAVGRDVPPPPLILQANPDEALLPPPPDQVGNITTPKTEEGPGKFPNSGGDIRNNEDRLDEPDLPEKPVLRHHDSVMTEDSIRPDDSASVTYPLTESGAPSETEAVSAGSATREAAGQALAAEPVVKELVGEAASLQDVATSAAEEPDLLGSLMGGLDRRAEPSRQVQDAANDSEPATQSTPPAVVVEQVAVVTEAATDLDRPDDLGKVEAAVVKTEEIPVDNGPVGTPE